MRPSLELYWMLTVYKIEQSLCLTVGFAKPGSLGDIYFEQLVKDWMTELRFFLIPMSLVVEKQGIKVFLKENESA